jgi:hypothetical protein
MTRISPAFGAVGRRIMRRMTMILAAAALALAGALAAASPARAQSTDDLVRFLLGAAAIAIIVRAIDEGHRPAYAGDRVLPAACLETIRLQGRQIDLYHRGCLRRAGYRGLPGHCEVSYRTAQGRRHGYEARCMQRAGYVPQGHHGQRPDHPVLPAACALDYWSGGQRLAGYDGWCLQRSGFRHLPRHCGRTTQGGEVLYDARCLHQAGYRRGR